MKRKSNFNAHPKADDVSRCDFWSRTSRKTWSRTCRRNISWASNASFWYGSLSDCCPGRSNHFNETNFKMIEKFLLLKPFRSPGRCADPSDPCRWACGLSWCVWECPIWCVLGTRTHRICDPWFACEHAGRAAWPSSGRWNTFGTLGMYGLKRKTIFNSQSSNESFLSPFSRRLVLRILEVVSRIPERIFPLLLLVSWKPWSVSGLALIKAQLCYCNKQSSFPVIIIRLHSTDEDHHRDSPDWTSQS